MTTFFDWLSETPSIVANIGANPAATSAVNGDGDSGKKNSATSAAMASRTGRKPREPSRRKTDWERDLDSDEANPRSSLALVIQQQ